MDTVAGGGMAGAEEAVAELEALLDRPTVAALGGVADALAEAGAAGALRRSLAAAPCHTALTPTPPTRP
ncbi:hypothetical protein [Streptomyces sp. NPDC001292]|uniref:hypothetical protein n=1 Tax=Streptomyces sp. NPDC001292 TaxID=3364558 RepID=UPI003695E1DE